MRPLLDFRWVEGLVPITQADDEYDTLQDMDEIDRTVYLELLARFGVSIVHNEHEGVFLFIGCNG